MTIDELRKKWQEIHQVTHEAERAQHRLQRELALQERSPLGHPPERITRAHDELRAATDRCDRLFAEWDRWMHIRCGECGTDEGDDASGTDKMGAMGIVGVKVSSDWYETSKQNSRTPSSHRQQVSSDGINGSNGNSRSEKP